MSSTGTSIVSFSAFLTRVDDGDGVTDGAP
jgi:hypothetical protein